MAAKFYRENQVKPVSFWLEDTEYKIDCVLEKIRGETLKKRGVGIRYKVRVLLKGFVRVLFLFRIGDIWYLAEQNDTIPDVQTRHSGYNYSGKKIIDNRYDNPHKVAVDVAAMCTTSGKVEPYAFWWEDGTEYQVDRILGQERAASLKAGIIGIRYKIRVRGRETNLFRDDDVWYMERKEKYRVLDVHGRPLL